MRVDITKALNAAVPWDLTLALGGRDRATVRPTVAQLAVLRRGGTLGDAEVRELVAGLFADPLEIRLDDEEVAAVLTAYATYYQQRTLKNVGAVAVLIRDQMNPKSAAGAVTGN